MPFFETELIVNVTIEANDAAAAQSIAEAVARAVGDIAAEGAYNIQAHVAYDPVAED